MELLYAFGKFSYSERYFVLDGVKVYNACIRSCRLYGNETWAMIRDNEVRLERMK